MKVVIIYQYYKDISIVRETIRAAFPNIEILESHTRDPIDVIDSAKGAEVVMVQFGRITSQVMDALPTLRGIVQFGIAVDNIDVEYAARKHIHVANVPHYCVEEVANHALTLLLALNRRLVEFHTLMSENAFSPDRIRPIRRMSHCTVGIVGCGAIGRALADRLEGISVSKVLFYDPIVSHYRNCRKVRIERLFAESDYISVHVPLNDSTRRMISWDLLSTMKPDACIINTARGAVIDEYDLVKVLEEKMIGGAALDVFVNEPLPPDSRLRQLDNVLLTPHIAAYSEEAMQELLLHAARQAVQILRGQTPAHPVTSVIPPKGDTTDCG